MKGVFSGVYMHDGFVFEPHEKCPFYWDIENWKDYIDHLCACKIDMMEFCTQASFIRIPSTDFEYNRIKIMKEVIRYAHSKGVKVWLILSANVLSSVPDGQLPVDQRKSKSFSEPCPQEPENLEKLYKVTTYFIEQYDEVDGYEIFAGDWGGCGCGKCDYKTYLWLAGEYYKIIRKYNKDALVCLNMWSVSSWSDYDRSNFIWQDIFDLETKVTSNILESIDMLPNDVGITIPFHHLYRPLAVGRRTYDECPAWPDEKRISSLRKSGREVFAWPHFIMENDPYHIGRWGYFNCRVRYLREIVNKLVKRNVSGIVGNLYNPYLQPLSAYAFGRLCADSTLDEQQILLDFAALISYKDDIQDMYLVLAFMENNDPWESDLPHAMRLEKLPSSIDLNQALELLTTIQPAGKSIFLADNREIINCMTSSLKLLSGPMDNAGLS